jgi:hypothetical protein
MEKLVVTFLFFLVRLNILKTERFKLDVNPIAPIYWVDSKSIFVNEKEKSYLYDVNKREIVKEYRREENQLCGYENDSFLICNWKNRNIKSRDEYSTYLEIGINGDEIINIELKPTVEVVECKTNPILKTVFPIEERYYIFKEDLYEIEKYRHDIVSPNLLKIIELNSQNEYWITKLTI